MALEKDVNSYVTLTEAEEYFLDRVDVAAWTNAADALKSQALVTATMVLDLQNWSGIAISDSQNLAFPRSGYYIDSKLGKYKEFPTTVPTNIIKATYEMAYHLLNNDGLLDSTGTVDAISIGQISIDIKTGAPRIPSVVKLLIKPYLLRNQRIWWRAN